MSKPFVNPLPAGTTLNRVLLTNERVTGPPGTEMLRQASDVLHDSPAVILDNACGAGVITALLQEADKARGSSNSSSGLKIIASDKEDRMITTMRTRVEESGWENVEVMQFDQADITLPDEAVSHVFTNFGIFFSPNDADALLQIRRVLKPDGLAGFTSWKQIAWWPMAQEALKKSLPDAPPLPGAASLFVNGWNDAAQARSKMEQAEFRDVTVEEFSFQPQVGAEEFGEATAELVKIITLRAWDADAREKFAAGIKEAITSHLKETYKDGIWDGYMTALITLGRK